ncbi:hypothetical protein BKA57DRAFT_467742 [Linnemannia elongata]|nr:hypothetical protein BKA57DRAFT_467742 [Linnemannia elongata]
MTLVSFILVLSPFEFSSLLPLFFCQTLPSSVYLFCLLLRTHNKTYWMKQETEKLSLAISKKNFTIHKQNKTKRPQRSNIVPSLPVFF